jgi:hypothetical protein
VYAARRSAGEIDVFDFGGALPDSGASTVTRIGPGVGEAAQALRERLTRREHGQQAPLASVS